MHMYVAKCSPSSLLSLYVAIHAEISMHIAIGFSVPIKLNNRFVIIVKSDHMQHNFLKRPSMHACIQLQAYHAAVSVYNT